jgi:acyl transferase domain-containing protein
MRKPIQNKNRSIAIIGMNGRFPKSSNLQEFWKNLCDNRICTGRIPKERKEYFNYQAIDEYTENEIFGGFLDNVDSFDSALFNISTKDADEMDPQLRIFLECVWSTFEDAGYGDFKNSKIKTGLFIGSMWNDYSLYAYELGFLKNDIVVQDLYAGISQTIPHF